jgi:hypothetical protein
VESSGFEDEIHEENRNPSQEASESREGYAIRERRPRCWRISETRERITFRERAMVISRKRRNTSTAATARRLAAPLGIPYSSRMSPLRARVEKGRLVLDEPTTLPEGTVVDLVADDEGDDLTNEERRALHEALSASWKSAEAGRLLPASRILDELRRRR